MDALIGFADALQRVFPTTVFSRSFFVAGPTRVLV